MSQEGSIYLSDQKLRVRVPRIRDVVNNRKVSLERYRLLKGPRNADEGVMSRILSGLSCRNYEGCAEAVPEAFGISSSSISRRFIKVSANKLRELMERDLSRYDFFALSIDGNSFSQDEMFIALLGDSERRESDFPIYPGGTEKEGVVRNFLQGLMERGFPLGQGLPCVIDGHKGIRSAIQKIFGEKTLVQRCQWHKRENVVYYLAKHLQATRRRKLQWAYEKPSYEEAKGALGRLKLELKLINVPAIRSLERGFEVTAPFIA
jgi:transposase-like protein